jgi:hypothetical protein
MRTVEFASEEGCKAAAEWAPSESWMIDTRCFQKDEKNGG